MSVIIFATSFRTFELSYFLFISIQFVHV